MRTVPIAKPARPRGRLALAALSLQAAGQRLIEIKQQIGLVLDAHRYPDEAVGNAHLLAAFGAHLVIDGVRGRQRQAARVAQQSTPSASSTPSSPPKRAPNSAVARACCGWPARPG
ncbi:hypothetical protein G6F50_017539 [Rhizopus delemar]|uniref:Uncharacterized protein n=1 Tax=Rhizopus delemar TaxID=936053 RepID=A0A9P7C0F6_9FUNG|nr:hypothetical protein G6F50_017539 [Rhizopus delemar]